MDMMSGYLDSLKNKRDELISYVTEQVDSIKVVANVPVRSVPEEKPASQKSRIYGLSAGILLFVIGLIAHVKILWISGLILIVVSLVMSKSARQHSSQDDTSQSEPDMSRLKSSVQTKIEDIHSYVTNEWEHYIDVNKEAIKSAVSELDIDPAKKQRIYELAVRRSVVSFSMLDVLSSLNNLARQKDLDGFKTYLQKFKVQYIAAIDAAYMELKGIYQEIQKLLNN